MSSAEWRTHSASVRRRENTEAVIWLERSVSGPGASLFSRRSSRSISLFSATTAALYFAFAKRIGRPGVALSHCLRRAFRRILAGLLLRLRVNNRAEQDHQRRQIKPSQQDDHAAQRAVGLVVAAEVGDVDREADGGDDPEDG